MVYMMCCVCCRSKQPTERSTQAADEGSIRRAVSDGSGPTELAAAVSANVDGSSRLCTQRLTDSHQPGYFSSVCPANH